MTPAVTSGDEGWCPKPTRFDAACCVCGCDVPAGLGRYRFYSRHEMIQVYCPEHFAEENVLRGIERVSS